METSVCKRHFTIVFMHVYSVTLMILPCFFLKQSISFVTGGRHLVFSNFQILFKFELLYFKMTRKQHLAVEIHKIVRIHCEVVSI